MKQKLFILGSTGFIGRFAVELALGDLKDAFTVEALSFHQNARLALEQATLLGVRKVYTTSQEGYEDFKKLTSEIEVYYGADAIKAECKNPEINVILLAIIGFAGLEFALESIIQSERILAIANKEAIICGNHLINKKLEGTNTRIIPVDSEHNSLYRLLKGCDLQEVESAFITGSGGPFLGKAFAELTDVSVAQVVRHPVWQMGGKISVDSATMANKGLELIEAYNLFPFLKSGSIKAFISKGSLLHAGLCTVDGACSLFLSNPDMKLHIANAITGGDVKPLNAKKINPFQISAVSIEEIKPDEFPIFFIAKQIAENRSRDMAISFNILNEIAVTAFLKGKIKYTKILNIIEESLGLNPDNLKFADFKEIKEYESFLNKHLQNQMQ